MHAEGLIGQCGMLTGALGETAEVTLKAKPSGTGTTAQTAIDVKLNAPRMQGAEVGFAMNDSTLWLTKPMKATWSPSVEFLNKMLVGEQEAQRARQHRWKCTAEPGKGPRGCDERRGCPAAVEGAGGAADFDPDRQAENRQAGRRGCDEERPNGRPVEARCVRARDERKRAVDEPAGSVQRSGRRGHADDDRGLGDGREVARARRRLRGMPIEANLNIGKVTGGGAASAEGKGSTAKVKISNLADAAGTIDTKCAVVNADIAIAAFPTPIVDNLAKQKGLLTEVLGPTVTLQATVRNLSQASDAKGAADGAGAAGALDVTATSQRATAKLKGDVKGGVFVQSGPVDIQVREIRSQLVKQLAGGLPLVESLEKTAQDTPAQVTTEGLRVPLDNDLTKLFGKVTVNPGVARFTTSNIMGQIIKSVGGKEGGAIGRKIEPFVVNIDKGVAKYDRFKLPFGEFNLETRGEVDLVQRKIDVVTYVAVLRAERGGAREDQAGSGRKSGHP